MQSFYNPIIISLSSRMACSDLIWVFLNSVELG